MRPTASRSFRALAGEAVADATRRRIVPVIAAVSLLSLLVIDSCTSCAPPTFVQDGTQVETPNLAGWSGIVLYAVLGLWTMVLAGVLASDHLADPLFDGSATLTLARPVSRAGFALARLAGVLAIAFATGALLLLATAAMLHARHGLALGPALWGALACAGGALSVAALAMTVSLYLQRIATALLVFVFVAAIGVANTVALFGAALGGLIGFLDHFGPPLATAIVVSLAPWIEPTEIPRDAAAIALRLALWAAGSAALLVLAFRRIEFGR